VRGGALQIDSGPEALEEETAEDGNRETEREPEREPERSLR
jgi:hypothetical protein